MTSRTTRNKRIERYENLVERASQLAKDGKLEQEAEIREEAAALAKSLSNSAPDKPRSNQWDELYRVQRRKADNLRPNEHNSTRPEGSATTKQHTSRDNGTTDSKTGSSQKDDYLGEFFEHPPDDGLDQIVGQTELKRRLHESVITPNLSPKHYERLDVGAEVGYLFHGPPGTGKTLTAKSVCKEIGVPVAILSPAQLTSKWAGEAPKLVKSVYEEARDVVESHGGACVVFDEMDSIASERDGSRPKTNTEVQAVSQLLTEIQEIQDKNINCLTIGTTNLKGSVDGALLRPGRLGTQIEVPAPGGATRVELLMHYMPPDEQVDLQDLNKQWFVNKTDAYTAADIEGVAAEAKRLAAYESATNNTEYPVKARHIKEAINRTEGTLSRWDPSNPDMHSEDLQHDIVGD